MPLKPIKPKEDREEEELEEEEEEKPIEKKPAKEIFLVAKELPKQEVRQVKLEDGSIGTVLTIEEALTQIINDIAALKKGLL